MQYILPGLPNQMFTSFQVDGNVGRFTPTSRRESRIAVTTAIVLLLCRREGITHSAGILLLWYDVTATQPLRIRRIYNMILYNCNVIVALVFFFNDPN